MYNHITKNKEQTHLHMTKRYVISKTVIKAKFMFHSRIIQGGLIHLEIFWFRKKITSINAGGGSRLLF